MLRNSNDIKDFDKIEAAIGDHFLVYIDEKGTRVPLKVSENKIVKISSLDEIVSHLGQEFISSDSNLFTYRQLRSLSETWLALSLKAIFKMPKSIALRNDDELAFNRINFSALPEPTPTYDILLSNIECNAQALEAFCYSLFVPGSYKQQYCWLMGQGRDGKGTLTRFCSKLLGDSACALTYDYPRLIAACVGKRLGIFNDINSARFPMKGKFKSLTGGDAQLVDEKYQKAYTVNLETKFMFTSNVRPEISSQFSDLRRLIFVEFVQKDGVKYDPIFEEKIWNERAGILFKWKNSYELLAPNMGPIECDLEVAQDLSEELEHELLAYANKEFEKGTEEDVLSNFEIKEWVKLSSGFREIDSSKLISFLSRHFKAKTCRIEKKGQRLRGLRGIRFKR